MDAAYEFAKYIVNSKYSELPIEVVEQVKKSILDTLGVTVAGSTTDKACERIVELVKEAGGKEESTILGFGGKVPAWMAAFANGSMSHVLDFDDTHDFASAHPTAHALIAGCAIAERVGGVNGKDLITAVALGGEMGLRLALARTKPIDWYGWLSPMIWGAFSSTAAAGKLLKLSEEQMVSAFGIAINQTAGSMEANFDTGSDIRAIRDCFSGKTGVLSALMAQRGIRGVKNSLEGTAGLFNLQLRGEYNRAGLVDDLGKRFEYLNTGFKPWPSCRFTHPYIDATLNIVHENDIRPEDVEEIVAVVGDSARHLMCEPLEERRRPPGSIDAKISIPFIIGVAVTRRRVVISDFLPEALGDPAVFEIAQKTTCRLDRRLDSTGVSPAVVEIKTKDGMMHSKRVDSAYGDPSNPLSMEDLIAKFRDCVDHSAKPLPKARVDEAISLITSLEEVKDVSNVIQLFG